MKRFVIGFAVGVGLMYYYLHYGDQAQSDTKEWFHGAASNYRDDRMHQAAGDTLGEGKSKR